MVAPPLSAFFIAISFLVSNLHKALLSQSLKLSLLRLLLLKCFLISFVIVKCFAFISGFVIFLFGRLFHFLTCLMLWYGKVSPHNLSLKRFVFEFVKGAEDKLITLPSIIS